MIVVVDYYRLCILFVYTILFLILGLFLKNYMIYYRNVGGKMKYKRTLIILASLIIILIIIALFWLRFNKAKTNTKKLDINSDLVQDLYTKVNPSNDGTILNLMYTSPGKFVNQYVLATGIHNIIKDEEFIVKLITEDELKNSIKRVFGKDIAFNHEDVYILNNLYCGYKYNNDSRNYEFLAGCDGDTNNYYFREIVEAFENKDELVILEKSIYVYYDWSEGYNYVYVYNNAFDRKIINEYSGKLDEIKFIDYEDKASTYKYVFRKVNGKYIFKSLELVK